MFSCYDTPAATYGDIKNKTVEFKCARSGIIIFISAILPQHIFRIHSCNSESGHAEKGLTLPFPRAGCSSMPCSPNAIHSHDLPRCDTLSGASQLIRFCDYFRIRKSTSSPKPENGDKTQKRAMNENKWPKWFGKRPHHTTPHGSKCTHPHHQKVLRQGKIP